MTGSLRAHRSIAIACAVAALSRPASAATQLAEAAHAAAPGAIQSILLPGGVEGLRRALDDRTTIDPAEVGVEIARRFYNGTEDAAKKDLAFARLHEWLAACERTSACEAVTRSPDAVPLPGDPAFWHDVVFDGRVRPEHTMLAILGNRGAALLYTALLSADEGTRAWLLGRPELVKRLADTDCGALVVVAPYLHIANGRWQLPGGAAAEPVWMDLAAARLEDSPAFLLALLRAHGGLLTYTIEAVATLTPAQQRAALGLANADVKARVAAGRDLLAALRPAAEGWQPGQRPFWRPSIDPAWLLTLLPVDADGRVAVPGGRRFWQLAFDDGDLVPPDDETRNAWLDPEPVSSSWLVDRVVSAPLARHAIRYEQVLFASRWLASGSEARAADTMTTIRGYARFPQLVRVLERMGVTDVRRLAAMVRRASELTRAGEAWRARAALMQWQSVIVLLDRAVRLGAATTEDIETAIDALSISGGGVTTRAASVRWLLEWLGATPAAADVQTRPIERGLVARMTGSHLEGERLVRWEGTTYRLDFGAAEHDRLAHARGRDARPLLDAAVGALALADRAQVPPRAAVGDLAALATITTAMAADRPAAIDDDFGRIARESAAIARRLLEGDGARATSDLARSALRDLGDALATGALVELAYAASMGWSEDLPLSAAAIARRHVFSMDTAIGRRDLSWAMPIVIKDPKQPWHVAGSLLGLDVALAPLTLRRLSLKPLRVPPTLNIGDRTLLITTAAVLDRREFTDEGQRLLVDLLARGRARLGAAHGSAGMRALAEEAGASTLRQALAGWTAEASPPSMSGFFSLTEVARLGLRGAPWPDALRAWGNYDAALTGRLMAGRLPALPWERYAGRSGRLLAFAVPDLQLALAAGLADMGLPAVLVPDLMPSATSEVINTAMTRHQDDWHAIMARAQTIDRDDVERYLGLLTVNGPLRVEPAQRTP